MDNAETMTESMHGLASQPGQDAVLEDPVAAALKPTSRKLAANVDEAVKRWKQVQRDTPNPNDHGGELYGDCKDTDPHVILSR